MFPSQGASPVSTGGLPNQQGVLTDLSHYRGHHVLLLRTDHFPVAGLSDDWRWLRDHYPEFTSRNTLIIGLNGHHAAINRRFIEQYQLPFDMISDPGGSFTANLDRSLPPVISAGLCLVNPAGQLVKWSSRGQLRDEMEALLGYLDARFAIGDSAPNAKVYQVISDTAQAMDVKALFSQRRIVLFAVPGAYTPACSAEHLPGYVRQADQIRDQGIDAIICLAVNDPFVMQAWGRSQNVEGRVSMVADGDGEFTRAMGMAADLRYLGLNLRSRRYAMIVNDGVIKHLNVEAGHQVHTSGADAMLKLL